MKLKTLAERISKTPEIKYLRLERQFSKNQAAQLRAPEEVVHLLYNNMNKDLYTTFEEQFGKILSSDRLKFLDEVFHLYRTDKGMYMAKKALEIINESNSSYISFRLYLEVLPLIMGNGIICSVC